MLVVPPVTGSMNPKSAQPASSDMIRTMFGDVWAFNQQADDKSRNVMKGRGFMFDL